MQHIRLLNVLVPVILLSSLAGATTISSTFDTDLDGWTSNPQGTVAFVATGGNLDGYAEETDASSNGNMHLTAPAKFLGDLTGGTSLSVDLRSYATPITIPASFGTLTFTNSAAALSIVLDLGSPSIVWTNYVTALNPAAFGVNSATYSAVMINVTAVTLILEADKDSDSEKVGMDNFAISGENLGSDNSVPEPATFSLLGATLIACGVARRKFACR